MLFLLNPGGKRAVRAPSDRLNPAVPRFAVPRPKKRRKKTRRGLRRSASRIRVLKKSSTARRPVAASRANRKEKMHMAFTITASRRSGSRRRRRARGLSMPLRRAARRAARRTRRRASVRRSAPQIVVVKANPPRRISGKRRASRRRRAGMFKKGWSRGKRRSRRTWFKANPPARRRRRRRRNLPHGYTFGGGRHAKSWLRNRPRRRGRRARARRNPPLFRRRRHARRRRNPGFLPSGRGFLGSIKAKFAAIFERDTAVQVVGGAAGLSVSLWGPKLLGFKVDPRLGRGWGGVASSVASVAVVSGLASMVSPKLARAMLVGGLIGSFAGALSAISCKLRTQVLPIETGLLACALPTTPSRGGNAAAAQTILQQLTAGGVNPAAAQQIANAATGMSGVGDYLNDYLNGQQVQSIVQGEQSYRRALGMGDYPTITGTTPVPVSELAAMPETF